MEPITVNRTVVADGVALNYMKTDLFKASVFVADLLVPLSSETSPYYSLLPQVLEREATAIPRRRIFAAAWRSFTPLLCPIAFLSAAIG